MSHGHVTQSHLVPGVSNLQSGETEDNCCFLYLTAVIMVFKVGQRRVAVSIATDQITLTVHIYVAVSLTLYTDWASCVPSTVIVISIWSQVSVKNTRKSNLLPCMAELPVWWGRAGWGGRGVRGWMPCYAASWLPPPVVWKLTLPWSQIAGSWAWLNLTHMLILWLAGGSSIGETWHCSQ